jgi:selenide,water dikinase
MSSRQLRDIVLVGGGHAHVQVLRRFEMDPPLDARVTVVLDTPIAVYSGMVPGFVAGQYGAHQLQIDVVPLARRAGARVILSAAVAVDVARRHIELADRPPIRYDLASFDIGSAVAARDLPGVKEHALSTRPIGRFVERVQSVLAEATHRASAEPFSVVVVGGGAGGVELAFSLDYRLQIEGVSRRKVTLLQREPRLLPGYPESLARRVLQEAGRRGIDVRCGSEVVEARADRLLVAGGEMVPSDLPVWVTGAVSHGLFERSGLPTDPHGFVWTRSTLQVEGYDDLLAVGDCGTLSDHPDTPKAGVYAVRQGPFVAHNLRAALEGRALRPYRPQRDFLTLLNLGDGRALGAKWGLSFGGRWVMRVKDRIDRRFVRGFQVLDVDGAVTDVFRSQSPMAGEMEPLCGGCAAKVGESALERALERVGSGPDDPAVKLHLSSGDDASARWLPDGGLHVASLDGFRAFTDDPFLVGRVSAVNAMSDLFAKGVRPRYAHAMVVLHQAETSEQHEETLFQVLSGAREAFAPFGVTLLGGHTMTSRELLVGFHVEADVPRTGRLLRIDGLRIGDRLILTKPLGTGVLLHADMVGRARGPWIQSALANMQRSNGAASEVAVREGATGATDVSGFGLAGHLGRMARASGVCAVLRLDALPALPGSRELLGQGLRSTLHAENERARKTIAIPSPLLGHPKLGLLFDPQTSGGLLFGAASKDVPAISSRLGEGPDIGVVIGEVGPGRPDGILIEVRA